MKVELPKDLRGATFTRLYTFEMNNFEVEELLPSLFFVIVSNGRRPRGRVNDPLAVDEFLDRLVQHPRLEGFDDVAGRQVLDRWVRSSIVQLGRVGKSRLGEQIRYLQPLTLLTYKTGLPRESGRRRRVDLYLYRSMRRALTDAGVERERTVLGKIFKDAFGREVNIGPAPDYDGRYDGESTVDLHTLLSLCYLDGFGPTPADVKDPELLVTGPSTTPALPAVERQVGEDLLRYVIAYRNRSSALALTQGMMALINVHLLSSTLRTVYATESLLDSGELPPVMANASGTVAPEIYVDFTRDGGGVSDGLAQACVERDLEALGRFVPHLMRLKALDRFVQGTAKLAPRVADLDNPEYLKALTGLANDAYVQVRAETELGLVEEATLEKASGETERGEVSEYFARIRLQHSEDAVAAYTQVMVDAQERTVGVSFGKWFWSVGGLRNSYGVIEGNLQGRRRARYVMSDGLLAALVQIAMVEDATGDFTNVAVRSTLSLRGFLKWMEERFGFIIDRPPDFMDGTLARAAARENLESLKRRLRQMGYYQALSDDFAAQYLRDPKAESVTS